MKAALSALALVTVLALAACGEDVSSPYLEFAGGGFIFNYRNAEAFYGFVANAIEQMFANRSLAAGLFIYVHDLVPPAGKKLIDVIGRAMKFLRAYDEVDVRQAIDQLQRVHDLVVFLARDRAAGEDAEVADLLVQHVNDGPAGRDDRLLVAPRVDDPVERLLRRRDIVAP